jgi:hypothetical protein
MADQEPGAGSHQPDSIDAELDVLLARAGMTVPESLLDGVRAGYRELRQLTTLLHARRSAYHEPATVYRMRRPGQGE